MRSSLTETRPLGADLLCLVLAFAVASGCTTLRPVAPTATGGYASIEPGDKLRIVTRDGRELRLVVTAVAADSLVGNPTPAGSPPVTVLFSEIAKVEKVQFSPAMGIPVGAGCVGAMVGTVVITVGALLLFLLSVAAGGAQDPGPSHPAHAPAAP